MDKKRASSIKKLLILVLILAVPGFLYYLLTVAGKNRYKPLPIYGPKQVAKTGHRFHGKYIPDTIYHVLPEFNLVDQDGNKVSLHSLDHQLTIVNFFYTRCPAACVRVCDYMDSLARNYKKNDMIHFASITVDPEHDTPAALKKFASRYQASALKWRFLTGDSSQIYRLARTGFLVNAARIGKDDFNLSNQMVLIDADKRIRGYYTGNSVKEVLRLNDEVKVQIAEELRKIKAPEL